MTAGSTAREFGSYRLDAAERLLLRSGQPVALTPKAFDLLVHLVEHAGHLLLRPVEDRVRSSIGVIQNWPAMLPR